MAEKQHDTPVARELFDAIVIAAGGNPATLGLLDVSEGINFMAADLQQRGIQPAELGEAALPDFVCVSYDVVFIPADKEVPPDITASFSVNSEGVSTYYTIAREGDDIAFGVVDVNEHGISPEVDDEGSYIRPEGAVVNEAYPKDSREAKEADKMEDLELLIRDFSSVEQLAILAVVQKLQPLSVQ